MNTGSRDEMQYLSDIHRIRENTERIAKSLEDLVKIQTGHYRVGEERQE